MSLYVFIWRSLDFKALKLYKNGKVCICPYNRKLMSEKYHLFCETATTVFGAFRNKLLKGKTVNKNTRFELRCSVEDREKLDVLSKKHGFRSTSDYVLSCALNLKVKSNLDAEITLELLRMNADLSRLGNLFRLSLQESSKYRPDQLSMIQDNLTEITQKIKETVKQL